MAFNRGGAKLLIAASIMVLVYLKTHVIHDWAVQAIERRFKDA